MTGDEAGDKVDRIVDAAAERADPEPDTFRPVSVDDRFTKRVRDDHAPNAALHDALRAAAEDDDRIHSVNLMGSHAPGNRHKGEPRYNVRVDVRNEGMGHPVLGATVAGRLVDRGDVRIEDVVECSDDHLVVSLRPIETRVEPIDVPYRDLPDDVVRVDKVEDHAVRTIEQAVGGPDTSEREVRQIARALATVVYTIDPDRFADDVDEPDAAPQAAFDHLLERADVDLDRFPANYSVTEVDGEAFEHGVIEDEEQARRVAERLLEEHADAPVPKASIRHEWLWEGPDDERTKVDHDVDDRYANLRVTVDDVSNRDVVREKERFVGLPDNVEVIVDAVEAVDGTKIPCGCGDYSVEVPERNAPEAIDVVCPECGNHFGHDKPAEDEPGADE